MNYIIVSESENYPRLRIIRVSKSSKPANYPSWSIIDVSDLLGLIRGVRVDELS